MININAGKNTELMKQCKLLRDYSLYVARVREYTKELSLTEAVDRAIDDCIQNHILEDFLRKNRAEIRKMSIFEYDEEKELKLLREGEREVGIQKGIEHGKRELVKKKLAKGKSVEIIADELEETVESIQNICEELKNSV